MTTLSQLGIRVNSRKLLNTAVELAESRLYFQALADGVLESHSGKQVRARLYSELESASDEDLLILVQQLIALRHVGEMSSQRFERIQQFKAAKNGDSIGSGNGEF